MIKKIVVTSFLLTSIVAVALGQKFHSLEDVYGASYLNKIKENHPRLYEKLEFDSQEGWYLEEAHEKHLNHPDVKVLKMDKISSGIDVVWLLKNQHIYRNEKTKKSFLLADRRTLLILNSQENHVKNFNTYTKNKMNQ